MKAFLYSRWDGSQDEFRLDAEQALDALTELMLEGLDARQALEWMRQHGFELAGLDMRVMGLDELRQMLLDLTRSRDNPARKRVVEMLYVVVSLLVYGALWLKHG